MAKHVYCPKCGCTRLILATTCNQKLEFNRCPNNPKLQETEGVGDFDEHSSANCVDCNEGNLFSDFVHNRAYTVMPSLPVIMRPLRPDEPIQVGLKVVNLTPELDTDHNGNSRVTPPLTNGEITSHNNGTCWGLTFKSTGGWVCPEEAELRDPAQYALFMPELAS